MFPLTYPSPGGKAFHMESLTSRQAADRLGVNAQKFHRLAKTAGLTPVLEVPGIRGAKFWDPADIEDLAAAYDLAAITWPNGDGDAA